MPRRIFKLKSRAVPDTARLSSSSSNFPRSFLKLQTGDYLLLQDGSKLKLQRP